MKLNDTGFELDRDEVKDLITILNTWMTDHDYAEYETPTAENMVGLLEQYARRYE